MQTLFVRVEEGQLTLGCSGGRANHRCVLLSQKENEQQIIAQNPHVVELSI